MFGYVVIDKPELKVKDFEIYNAVYCSLCRKMGKTYGPLSKFCLNYDFTFVALLEAALIEKCSEFEQKRCRVNPFKKCTYCKNDNEFLELAAAAGLALTDLKVRDNIDDGGFFSKIGFGFLRLFTKRWSKKAYKLFPRLKEIILDYGMYQFCAQRDKKCGLDKAAEPSAKALEGIFSLIKTEEKYKFVLERMGYCLGKWIYLIDAADDIEKDIKTGNFNPLIARIGKDYSKEALKETLEPILNNCIVECRNYCELLDIKKHKSIIDNILYLGLQNKQNKILSKEKSK